MAQVSVGHAHAHGGCGKGTHVLQGWRFREGKLIRVLPSQPCYCRYAHHAGIDHIHDPRNGLLLCKPLEWAFDNSKLSIVPNSKFTPTTFQVRSPRSLVLDV
jgi:hypothetical protein